MIDKRRTNITTWWSAEANGYLLRTHHWGPHGYSTKIVFSEGEAKAFFYQCDNRKPAKRNRRPSDGEHRNGA